MNYNYSLINTTFNTQTKEITYTFSYMTSTGTFEQFTGSEQQLQDHLSTL